MILEPGGPRDPQHHARYVEGRLGVKVEVWRRRGILDRQSGRASMGWVGPGRCRWTGLPGGLAGASGGGRGEPVREGLVDGLAPQGDAAVRAPVQVPQGEPDDVAGLHVGAERPMP